MTVLDIQTAKEISELLEEGKALDEIRKSVKWHGGTINAWIADALLSNDIDDALLTLRNAIITRVLKDTAILGMLKAASKPSENKSYKTTILSELSKSDKALLEQQGYQAFIKQVETDKIVLKVEETITSVAPDPSLYKEILKAISGNDKGITQKYMEFNKPHPDLPPV
jgi:hypothetical protein